MTTREEVDQWIAGWNEKQARDYDSKAPEREARDRDLVEKGIMQQRTVDLLAGHDLDDHLRRRFPTGAYLDSIRVDQDSDWRPDAVALRQCAEAGVELLYAAILTADEDDNA